MSQPDKVKKTSCDGVGRGCDGERLGEGFEEVERRGEGGAVLLLLLLLEHCGHHDDRGRGGGLGFMLGRRRQGI